MNKCENFVEISASKTGKYVVPDSNIDEMCDFDVVKKAANSVIFESTDFNYTFRLLTEIFTVRYGGIAKTAKHNLGRLFRKLIFKLDLSNALVRKTGVFTHSAVMQINFKNRSTVTLREKVKLSARKNKVKLNRILRDGLYRDKNVFVQHIGNCISEKDIKLEKRRKRRKDLRDAKRAKLIEKNSENDSDDDMFVNQMMIEPNKNRSDGVGLDSKVDLPTGHMGNVIRESSDNNIPTDRQTNYVSQNNRSAEQNTCVEFIPQVGLYIESKIANVETFKNRYEISIWQDLNTVEAMARSMLCRNSPDFTDETNVRYLPNAKLTSLDDYAMTFQIDGFTEQLIDLNSNRVLKSKFVKNLSDGTGLTAAENQSVKKISAAQLKFNPFMGCELSVNSHCCADYSTANGTYSAK